MKATIYVKRDDSCEMARVYTRIGTLPKGMKKWDFGMEGNYWDFHPYCHGMLHFGTNWKGASSLADAMKSFLENKGYSVKVVEGTYKYK